MLFTSQQYFTVWYLCIVQIIIPVNHLDQYVFRVPLDWIDSIIISKWFNTPFLECTHIARYVFWWCFCVYVQWLSFLVLWGGVELGVVVTHVVFPIFPINESVLLIASIPNPLKARICSLGYALLYRFINDTWWCCVFCLHWHRVFEMSHFFQRVLTTSLPLVLMNRSPNSASAEDASTIKTFSILISSIYAKFKHYIKINIKISTENKEMRK